MDLFQQIRTETVTVLRELYQAELQAGQVQVEPTNPDFSGDVTLIVFPFLKYSGKVPEQTATELGNRLKEKLDFIIDFNIVKGFLNFNISASFWIRYIQGIVHEPVSLVNPAQDKKKYLIEYSSPNTNKPLHLGHVRNNLLGHAIAGILKARGHQVIKANLVNDRGIHICKSMLAWMKYGNNETPESAGIKGDFLIGKYYVLFEKKYREEIESLTRQGLTQKEAEEKSILMTEARELLRKWEENDPETRSIWQKLNNWAYEGFDKTYSRMGISFDRVYYESETYQKGKILVDDGLEKGVFYRKEDHSVWCSLVDDGMDEKLLLRPDGTSVYMTQDLGTAEIKFNDYCPDISMYIVGNEQEYHFKVLKLLLARLGKPYAKTIFHLSYGMVDLPEGKMKSREGKVVDADDLMDEMTQTAADYIKDSGKLVDTSEEEINQLAEIIGLGALKFFILKSDARKNITFNPAESIDFQGFTGPFVQYTHARIKSVLRKAGEEGMNDHFDYSAIGINPKELDILKKIYLFNKSLTEAEANFDPAIMAQYAFQLAKLYNKFYHDHPILKNPDKAIRNFRLLLSKATAIVLQLSLSLCGIEAPEKM